MTTETTTGARRGTLSTFAGVFTPSIMTILGIILFMRLGYVVGNAGLGGTLAILGIATTISTLTSISLSAIATNMRVKGGGDYYLISRTLGIEMGGAIGIVLYLAQSVSIAFYAIGFGEVVQIITGNEGAFFVQAVSAAGILALFVLAWFGTDAATKFQYVVMVVMSAALISFFIGAGDDFQPGRLSEAWNGIDGGLQFWVVFAIFFPAVTGFTQGVSMSGELRDPAKSLSTGTFAAVGLSTIVYLISAVLFAGAAALSFLVEETNAMTQIAIVPWLVDAGVITATLSSAMASFMGAPRILQSLATDRIFPFLNWFSEGSGPSNNPRRAVLLSLAIALATVSLGRLDVVAPIVSMFFLISYGLLNYATAYEASSGSPSFRPRFRFFHRRLSWAGALLCLGAMLAVNAMAAGVSLAFLWAIHRYVGSRPLPDRWSDAAYSHYFQRANDNIKLLAGETESARHWRPQLILFSAETDRSARLLRFGSWMEGTSGMSAIFQVVTGSGAVKRREAEVAHHELQEQVDAVGGASHPRVVVAPTALGALPVIVQAFGVGPLKANTAVFGWPQDAGADVQRRELYGTAFMEVLRYGANGITVTTDPARWDALDALPARHRRIDVWWTDAPGGQLALLSAYLFTRHRDWPKATIRLLADAGDDPEATTARLQTLLDDARIDADIHLVEAPNADRIAELSTDAAAVLLTMRVHRTALLDPFGGDLYELMERLPLTVTFTTKSGIDIAAGPETGDHAVLVATEERVAAAIRRLHRLEDAMQKAQDQVDELQKSSSPYSNPDLQSAIATLDDIRRRTLKARVNVESAKAEARELKTPRGRR